MNRLSCNFLRLKQKSLTLPLHAHDRDQTPFRIRKCSQHLPTVFQALDRVCYQPIKELHGLLSPNSYEPPLLLVKSGAAGTDQVVFLNIHNGSNSGVSEKV